MSYLVAAASDSALYTAAALSGVGLGLLLLVMAAVARRRPWALRYVATCVTAGTVAFAVALAAGMVSIWTGRLEMVRATMPGTPDGGGGVVHLAVERQIVGSSLIGGTVLVFVIARTVLRDRKTPFLEAAWSLPLVIAAAGALPFGLRLARGVAEVARAPAAIKPLRFFDAAQGAHVVLDWARVGVGAAVVIAAVAVMAGRSEGTRTGSPRKTLRSALILTSGLAAYAVTRGHASDHSPLPLLSGGSLNPADARRIPRASRCLVPPEPAPLLRVDGDEVTLNGSPVGPVEFQDHLETIRRNHPLLHDRTTASVLAIVRASSETPVARLIPYLERAGTGEVHVASAIPRSVQTRTLGTIERYEYCGQPLHLTASGRAISDFGTWSRLCAALEHTEDPLEISAR